MTLGAATIRRWSFAIVMGPVVAGCSARRENVGETASVADAAIAEPDVASASDAADAVADGVDFEDAPVEAEAEAGVDASDDAAPVDAGAEAETGAADACLPGSCLHAAQIAIDAWHVCMRTEEATVRCWGYDIPWADGATQVATAGGVGKAMYLGMVYSSEVCAVLGDGTVVCAERETLNGPPSTPAWDVGPAPVAGLSHVVQMSLGGMASCALIDDGTVRCWGRNAQGELGDGTTTDSDSAVEVVGIHDAVEVSAGGNFACARHSDGTVSCWGARLGNGDQSTSWTPVLVQSLAGVRSISCGARHACAALDDGTLRCWGENESGQLGDGTKLRRDAPVAVVGLTDAVAVAAATSGGSYMFPTVTCAIHGSGAVACWGTLGGGNGVPVEMPGMAGASQIATSGGRGCALTDQGAVVCSDVGTVGW